MRLTKNRKRKVSFWIGLACGACGLLVGCHDGYDLMDEDPSWLGSSIYDYLKSNGNYTNMVRIIDDLGQANVLAKTGSKTLFVADDDAFNRFYSSGRWGAHSYDELTLSQKKLLLNGAMINNSCQVAYLSSSMGPREGDCMRRVTSSSRYDSVCVLRPADMPNTPYWQYYRDKQKTIPCFTDFTVAPMVHLIEDFVTNRKITNEDCSFLFNNRVSRKAGDAFVNGSLMTEQNIRCSNGFVHKMGEVVTPLPSMADIITTNSNTQRYAALLNRFSAPYYVSYDNEYNIDATTKYNETYGTSYDSVFQRRYFSDRSQGGMPLNVTPQDRPVPATLRFDPGWNSFLSQMNASTSADVVLQENMAVMLVPSDAALDKYWNEGGGRPLRENYGTWDNVPDKVVAKMINVNMLNSFINSVPSKFNTVLDDANDPMGITVQDIDSVVWGCNGMVYITNKVFNPVAYVSVSFPALVNSNMSIIDWAIRQLGYEVYLNSQSSYYSFFIPTNEALHEYVDPCSFGRVAPVQVPGEGEEEPEGGYNTTEGLQVFRFHYDPNATEENKKVWASVWKYNPDYNPNDPARPDSIREASYDEVINRLKDILESHIIIGNVEDGNVFYKAKNGGVISVANATAGVSGMKVSGGYQLETREPLGLYGLYDMSKQTNGKGNGKSYVLNDTPLMSSRKSVYDILLEHSEFSAFRELLEATPYLSEKIIIGQEEHACPSKSINLFNTFNYTVYVPTNAAIRELQRVHKLPTLEQIDYEEDEEERERLQEQLNQFVKYHIQDNALYIGQGNLPLTNYETAAYEVNQEMNTLSYFKLAAQGGNDRLSVTDRSGQTRNVMTSSGLYNLMAREYQYNTGDKLNPGGIYTSSFAVVHLIDGALDWQEPLSE